VRDGDLRRSGDLTKRKLIPALYNLATSHLLRSEFAVVAIGRSDMSTDGLPQEDRQRHPRVRESESIRQSGTAADCDLLTCPVSSPMRICISGSRRSSPMSTRSTARAATACTTRHCAAVLRRDRRELAQAGLTREENGTWQRVVIEKPFGRDLESARA
jgi:glucose-6-phosphate 1-dehydrogenase